MDVGVCCHLAQLARTLPCLAIRSLIHESSRVFAPASFTDLNLTRLSLARRYHVNLHLGCE